MGKKMSLVTKRKKIITQKVKNKESKIRKINNKTIVKAKVNQKKVKKNRIHRLLNKEEPNNTQNEGKSKAVKKTEDVEMLDEQEVQSHGNIDSKTSNKEKKKSIATTAATKSKFMLYVSRLGGTVLKNRLEEHFTAVAPVKNLMLFRNPKKTSALVEFATNEECEKALALNGSKLEGRVISVIRSKK